MSITRTFANAIVICALLVLATPFVPLVNATGPTTLGRTPWQVHLTPSYISPVTNFGQHGAIAYYAYAPSIPAANEAGWGPCGTPGTTEVISGTPHTVCPDANTINMHLPSRMPTCMTNVDFMFFQSFVSIPSDANVTQFQVVMNGADDGARVSIVNSAYPSGLVIAGSYIFLGGSQSTSDLSPYIVKGEVNRVVVTQMDDCAVQNNLNFASINLNGTIVPVVDNDLTIGPAPADVTTAATSSAGATVTYTAPTASDENGETPVVTCDPASGSTFPIGTTTVTCTATDPDDSPNSVSTSFTVTVTDTDLAITTRADIVTAPVAGISTTVAYDAPTATDEDGDAVVSCDHPSGSAFPLGTTTVICTASSPDDTPSSVSSSFTVTVPFASSGAGSFVIADQSTADQVTFWSAQWAKMNTLTGGSAPSAFKGFVPDASASCGSAWTTAPGNSSSPPATVGAYIAVIVSSSVSSTGSSITGNTTKIVVVQTDSGYAGNPGHPGTGKVVATLCG